MHRKSNKSNNWEKEKCKKKIGVGIWNIKIETAKKSTLYNNTQKSKLNYSEKHYKSKAYLKKRT